MMLSLFIVVHLREFYPEIHDSSLVTRDDDDDVSDYILVTGYVLRRVLQKNIASEVHVPSCPPRLVGNWDYKIQYRDFTLNISRIDQ